MCTEADLAAHIRATCRLARTKLSGLDTPGPERKLMGDEYHYLVGADDIKNAGHTIADAATTMQLAANDIAEANSRQQVFLNDWLDRLETILSDARQP